MFYRKLNTFASCAALGLLPAMPAPAHSNSAPLDAASQHFSDVMIAAAAVSLLGIAAYYALAAVAASYERRRHLSLDQKIVKSGTLLATVGAVVLLWRLAAPAPLAVASTGIQTDMPQHGGQIQSVGGNHLKAAVRAPPAPADDTAAAPVVAAPMTPEERALFLKPGSGYTAADIAANGGLTPTQKFQGMMAEHHLHPAKGTFICPITRTQANEKFAWVVSGKKYLFCCPPCVTEFVKQANQHPGSLKPPHSYVQL